MLVVSINEVSSKEEACCQFVNSVPKKSINLLENRWTIFWFVPNSYRIYWEINYKRSFYTLLNYENKSDVSKIVRTKDGHWILVMLNYQNCTLSNCFFDLYSIHVRKVKGALWENFTLTASTSSMFTACVLPTASCKQCAHVLRFFTLSTFLLKS